MVPLGLREKAEDGKSFGRTQRLHRERGFIFFLVYDLERGDFSLGCSLANCR